VTAAAPSVPRLGSSFRLLLLGETAYALGSALMQFALGVWVYQTTGSAEQFVGVVLSATIPALVLLPWAGTLADRFDRRWVIVSVDAIAIAMTLTLAGLLFRNRLAVGHLYVFSAISAGLGSIRGPSYQAAVTAIVPKDSLTRAGAFIGLSQAALALVAPLVGGGLMTRFGLGGVVLIQVPMMIGGILAVFGAFSHSSAVLRGERPPTRGHVLQGFLNGLTPAIGFLKGEPLMLRLLAYTAVHDGLLVLASSMLTPLILATHSSITLGLVSACGAAGGLGGSAALAIANTRRRIMSWMLACNVCLAICVCAMGLRTSTGIWCTCAFLGMQAGAASSNFAMTLWMRKVPDSTRGSVFSFLTGSHLVVSAIVVFVGGTLGDKVFEPALVNDGPWSSTIGLWLGTGKGHGLGLLFVVTGVLCAAISLVALVRSSLRRLDEVVGDAPEVASAT
jgi:diaminobutyrate-2-oxoglutarate transaminase